MVPRNSLSPIRDCSHIKVNSRNSYPGHNSRLSSFLPTTVFASAGVFIARRLRPFLVSLNRTYENTQRSAMLWKRQRRALYSILYLVYSILLLV